MGTYILNTKGQREWLRPTEKFMKARQPGKFHIEETNNPDHEALIITPDQNAAPDRPALRSRDQPPTEPSDRR
jgi:hypothetical protein